MKPRWEKLTQALAFDGFGELFDDAGQETIQISGGRVRAFSPGIHFGHLAKSFEHRSQSRTEGAAGWMKDHRRGLFGNLFIQRIDGDSNGHEPDAAFLADLRDGKAAGVDGETGEAFFQRRFVRWSDRVMIGDDQFAHMNSFTRRDCAFNRQAVDVSVADFIRQHDVAGLHVF